MKSQNLPNGAAVLAKCRTPFPAQEKGWIKSLGESVFSAKIGANWRIFKGREYGDALLQHP